MRFDIDSRMEQILGQPPRMEPLAENEIAATALVAIERLRSLNDGQDDGKVHPDFATLGRHPDLLAAFLDFGARFLTETALPPRLREIAILRTGWLCGAPFEWGEHVIIGKEAGLMSEDIERITLGSSATGWNEIESAVLAAVEELHADAMISDETWAVLARHLDERQLIELPVLVGQYHKVAFIQNSLRFRTRECNPGLSAR